MKRFVLNGLLFLAIMVCIDMVGRFTFATIQAKGSKGVDVVKDLYFDQYEFDSVRADVIIMGASRAYRHYNPYIIRDSLQMTCWNCGASAIDIIFSYGKLSTILTHYKPKLVVYEMCPYNYIVGRGQERDLSALRTHAKQGDIASIFDDLLTPLKSLCMRSALYQYNGFIKGLVASALKNEKPRNLGFVAAHDTMKYDINVEQDTLVELSSSVYGYYHKFIRLCRDNDVPLIMALSPKYNQHNSYAYAPFKEICKKYDVPVVDHFADPRFSYTKKFFADSKHMNLDGANAYTKVFVGEIKELMDKRKQN